MELLPLVCVSLLTWSGTTFAAENGTTVVIVKEGDDAILPCSLSSKEDITLAQFDWKKLGQEKKEVFMYDKGRTYDINSQTQDPQFKGRVSHFPDELKSGIASIIINDTKLADGGNYTCIFPDLQPSQIFYIQLVVGKAPKLSVKILDQTKDWALLQCKVEGAFPKPEVHWQDRAGKILPAEKPQETERGGLYDIILKTTVTKSGNYSCNATQKEICHQTDAETFAYIHEQKTAEVKAGSASGLVAGSVLKLFLLTVFLVLLF